MRAEAVADTIHESNKTLTRYNDDEDLEAMRKAEIRKGDPMAEYLARKKKKEKGITEGIMTFYIRFIGRDTFILGSYTNFCDCIFPKIWIFLWF